ncbi:MAG: hypothetical protein J5979_03755 [Lachnospiraceae bacterium]|nr:hypothetical protein [Lachnospiraceae bacterium]
MKYEEVVSAVKQILTEKGMKQCVVAERAGFSEQEFSNMLNGRKLLRVEYIPKKTIKKSIVIFKKGVI